MAEIDRQAIALEHIGLVKKVASKIFYKLPPCDIEFDDLVNTGMIGLMKAIDKYDREQAKFSTYAYIKIRGEILDYLRSLEVVPRTMKAKIRKEEEENPDKKPLPLSNAAVMLSMDAALTVGGERYRLIDTLVSGERTPEAEAELSEMADIIGRVMRELGDMERRVLQMLFFEEREPKEVSELIGVSVSRVSQIKSKAVSKLKSALAKLHIETV